MVNFQELGLREDLLQGIAELGFQQATPIQELVIPAALEEDNDFIALAQTGTGKTAAFGLPLLQRCNPDLKHLQGLILCPTRELCVQVANDLGNYAKHSKKIKVVAVYGGAAIEPQVRQIKAGAQIVVATPGRLVDLLQRQVANMDYVERVVLDEADEMLNMGFKDALDIILEAVPERQAIWLFSATMPNEVRRIARDYMDDPVELSVGATNQTNTDIEHEYYMCRADSRYMALKRIVDANPGIYGLIFCRTKNETKDVAEQMIRDGYNADALHGDLVQADRDRVMNRFREGNLQLLVATDVAARGIDVSDISHVINYNLPDEPEVYTHRSGRTGRAGRKGISISLVTGRQEDRIRQIERKSKASFTRKQIPTGHEICEKQLFHIIKNIHDQKVAESDIDPFLPKIYKELEDLSKEELIKRFASVEFNRFLEYYRDAPEINIGGKGERGEKGKSSKGASAEAKRNGMQRLFVNIGLMDGVTKKEFLKLLAGDLGVPGQAIGEIDIKKSCLHVNIESKYVKPVWTGLEEFTINGRPVRVDEARETGGSGGGGGRFNKPDRGHKRSYDNKFGGKKHKSRR
ncbi:MAG: DEAD/DEAH box helicase [Saprospiraceae bacterium]